MLQRLVNANVSQLRVEVGSSVVGSRQSRNAVAQPKWTRSNNHTFKAIYKKNACRTSNRNPAVDQPPLQIPARKHTKRFTSTITTSQHVSRVLNQSQHALRVLNQSQHASLVLKQSQHASRVLNQSQSPLGPAIKTIISTRWVRVRLSRAKKVNQSQHASRVLHQSQHVPQVLN